MALPDGALVRPSEVPLRDQLVALIRQAAQELGSGAKLPTEGELIERYDVSRATVRRAVDILVEEGIVVRHAGLGTFVRSPAVRYQMSDQPFADSLFQPGADMEMRLVRFAWVPFEQGPEAHAGRDGWLEAVRAISREGRPVAAAHLWIPEPIAGRVSKSSLEDHVIYQVLRSLGVEPARTEFLIGSQSVPEAFCDLLALQAADPVLVVKRKTFDDAGALCAITNVFLPASDAELELTIEQSTRPMLTANVTSA